MNKKSKTNFIPDTSASRKQYRSSRDIVEKELSTGISAYRLWHQRLATTLDWRNNWWNGTKRWNNAYRLYAGNHWNGQDLNPEQVGDEPNDYITVNLTGSNCQNLVPFLLNSMPLFVMKPRKPSSIVSAIIQQSLLNYEYRKRNMHREVRKCVNDLVIIGHCVARTGFTIEVDEALKKAEGEINYNEYIKDEAPYLRRVDPRNFIYDVTGSSCQLDTARWAGEVHYVPIRDIMVNSSYSKVTLKQIEDGTYSIETKSSMYAGLSKYDKDFAIAEQDKDSDLGILYEIWDKKHKKFYVFAAGVEPPLVEKEWPYPYLNGFPYRKADYIPIPNQPYGVGIPFMMEDQQIELDRIRTSMVMHRRSFHRMYQVVADLDEAEKDKLSAGEDGTIIEVDQIGMIAPIPPATISQDMYNTEAAIQEDIRQLTGLDKLMQGGQLPSRTTGFEVQSRTNLFRAKLDDRVAAVDEFVLDLAEQVLQHCKANYLRDQVVKIVGIQGEQWVEFSVEDIQEDVDIEMESVAAPKKDPILESQQALQLMQIVAQMLPLVQQGVLQLDFNELVKWVFEKMGLSDASRFFPHSATPVQSLPDASSSNFNQTPQANVSPMSVQDLQKQTGLAPMLNASGLQGGSI